MRTVQINGATSAPFPQPEALQRSRVLGRVDVSESVADLVASLVYGTDRRDDFALLAGMTASRTASSNLGVAHG